MPDYTQAGRPFRVYTPAGDDVLLIEKLEGREEMSRPFEFRLEMLSTSDSVQATDLINKPVHVEIDLQTGGQRFIHGRVSNFVQRGQVDTFTAYRAIVRPWFWFLSLVQDCRIFQNKSVPDIVEQIFTDLGYTDFTKKLYGTYNPRDYCVQYRESSMDFISRLLEEEGIFYFFEHTADKHTMILTDKAVGCTPCPEVSTASVAPVTGASVVVSEDYITEIEQEVQAIPGKVALTDYNFQTPSTSLLVNSDGQGFGAVYDHPGKHDNRGAGENYTGIRLEEEEATVKIIRGTSSCRWFIAGYKFDLKNHYSRPLNITYLLTSLKLSMATNAYRAVGKLVEDYKNDFEAMPASVQFRPARLTRKPIISGVQPAKVVGPAGEEIYTDKYGRVKVQFFWDRLGKNNENSSCWIRVSQDWAGKNWGGIFNPRIGQEVVVDFVEGDPDRPLITGRVYNAEQMPPYDLPANQTQSGFKTRSSKGGGTSNFNEFRFEDKMGSEEIFLHAEKDLNSEVENDESRKVGHDRTTEIKNDETKTVKEGNETITIEQGNQSTTLNQGNQSTQLKMGDQSHKLDMGNQSITLSMGNQTTKLDLGAASTEAMQSITLTVGESKITVDQMGVTIEGMMIKINGQIQVQIQGMMVQMSGSAMVQISGGIIMIG